MTRPTTLRWCNKVFKCLIHYAFLEQIVVTMLRVMDLWPFQGILQGPWAFCHAKTFTTSSMTIHHVPKRFFDLVLVNHSSSFHLFVFLFFSWKSREKNETPVFFVLGRRVFSWSFLRKQLATGLSESKCSNIMLLLADGERYMNNFDSCLVNPLDVKCCWIATYIISM